ncbi:MAG: N-acetyl sugar amidotransferase [Candidatus Omnitrophica bacterium CG11_big_fil_rev_8_21_14_0_20_64_10]|nr:MAG: N-acetyl sugar amidotransferase [Candidatus Omnitrophica bacterium CG11_big_fil_rev_8_21_14_0_20_64_10]
MRACRRCILPETRPNLTLDAEGICGACRAFESRRTIDWEARAKTFERVTARAKRLSTGYDCLVPVSGGKDSTWQTVTCLEAGLRVLAVTWKTPVRTAIGQANLDNLVRLGVDHIDYQIHPEVEKRFMWKALERFGTPAIPMHMALFQIPLKVATAFGIPLLVFGENSAFEYGGPAEDQTGFELNSRWLARYGVMQGTTAADWVDETLSRKDLTPYFGPSDEQIRERGVKTIFLGYYFPWDPQRSLEAARQHGFQSNPGGARTGLYDFADIDDDFISIHHHLKWLKFGFTRSWDNLSLEIRNGRITRAEAIERLRRMGDETPHADIERFCAYVGVPRARFDETAQQFRNRSIWAREGGIWKIPDFPIPDWDWSGAAAATGKR